MSSTASSRYRLKFAPITCLSQLAASIFPPTSNNTPASAIFRYRNFSIMPASAKYKLRKPRIANTLLVNTRNGSPVIAKIAGIESTAKIRSVNSTISSASGLYPDNGVYEELCAFGTRSFSIWDAAGNQVFDSGDDLEWITALQFPTRFNASNSNNTRDNRSDDKGPEPEGVAIGKVAGRTYAFIALERIGGIVVYDVSDPGNPTFVTYENNRNLDAAGVTPAAGDLGPEGIIFIKEDESPNGRPLVVIGNEISGTTTVFEITVP